MKLRHIFTAGALALATMATAQTAVDPSELRIYINPGHGSWTGGDRAMATIKHGAYNPSRPDTTGFFESNTNLWKGLSLLDGLASYGIPFDRTLNQDNPNPARRGAALDLSQNIVMSHVKLGPYPITDTEHEDDYNRDLYEIACEVELNNFDFFISVHSNAHVDGYNTNYPAFFVRGENKTALSPGSDDASKVVWPYAYQDEHQCWSNFSMENPAVYYDIDFWSGNYLINNIGGKSYKGYYGVLRHGVTGFLVEGYFHTYQPGRHRAMNPDVCRHEGMCYAHGLAALFGLSTESTGEIYGIVRDQHESFRHQYYSCSKNSPDNLKPLNNVEVKLYKDGSEVATYTTDDEWNGAFLFKGLEPGEYTISATAEGYKPAHADFCGPFTVTAAKTVYPCVYLESEDYVPPVAHFYDYPDEAAGATAVIPADSYTFKRGLRDKVVTALKGKTIRRFINYGNRLYVLAVDADRQPTVLVLDAERFTTVATVRTTGCEGTEYALSDIAVTSDGVLIGCSMELCHLTADYVEEGEERGECNIYRWQNDQDGLPTGAPKLWFTTQMTGNFFKAWTGETMAYTGTLADGRMVLSSASVYYNRKIFFTIIDIADEKKDSESFSNKSDICDYFNVDDLGDGYRFSISPLSSQSFITNSVKVQPRQYTIDNMHLEGEVNGELIPAAAAQSGYFRFAGRSMMAAPRTDAEGRSCGISLYDLSAGLDNAKAIKVLGIDDMEALEGCAAATGRTVVTRDDEDNITRADMILYLIREGGKISRYSTEGVDQPVTAPSFAYGLSLAENADTYTATFSLAEAATAHIELVSTTDDTDIVVLPSQQCVKGLNGIAIAKAEVPEGSYNWSVVVENESVAGIRQLFSTGESMNGVTIDRNPASERYGHFYFSQHAGNRGIAEYTPDMTPVNTELYQNSGWDYSVGASCWRLGFLPGGMLMISDWGDKQGGIFLMDPANPTAARKPMFIGTQDSSTGAITNAEGKLIGGSTSDMSVLGSGDETMLYSFQEELPAALVGYPIGTSTEITSQPTVSYPKLSANLPNGNVTVVAHPKGLFLGEVRGAGNNNGSAPVMIIADYEDNILYNSGKEWEALNGGDGGICINEDATRVVVCDASGVCHVCTVDWGDKVTVTENYSFPLGTTADIYQSQLDPAGRLLLSTRAGIRVFAIPQPSRNVSTPGAGTISGTGAGVENIAIDSNAPAEYYNLQGMRVDADNITPGVYIRRQGDTVTKVIMR